MAAWSLLAILGAGVAFLASRGVFRRSQQRGAANAAGLSPAPDLTHLTPALQRTALWTMSDGGFEQRVVHGVLSRNTHDIDVTAFDLETLRDRRGEWAYLPLDQPFEFSTRDDDPHVWMDPTRIAEALPALAEALGEVDPAIVELARRTSTTIPVGAAAGSAGVKATCTRTKVR